MLVHPMPLIHMQSPNDIIPKSIVLNMLITFDGFEITSISRLS